MHRTIFQCQKLNTLCIKLKTKDYLDTTYSKVIGKVGSWSDSYIRDHPCTLRKPPLPWLAAHFYGL